MPDQTLFSPLQVGAISLANRIVMAPLTRNRARHEDDTPTELHAEYYAQRATAGLIITEAAQISPEGKGYAWTPGIYSPAQIAGWRKVTDAVHAKGGKIVIQLWHVGRVSHTVLQPDGKAPVAPSAITAATKTFDGTQFLPTSEPRALKIAAIARIVADYAQATRNARAAGFDGVEIHAANGYLIDQFLRDGSNTRTDAYGGPIENRTRFLAEVLAAVVGAWDAGHVGIRLSPFSNANGISDSNPVPLFEAAVDLVDKAGLAYLHMVEGQTGGSRDLAPGQDIDALRRRFKGVYIANNGYTRAMAMDAVASGRADLVAFGRPFIANPDLVERLRRDAALNPLDATTLYGGGAKGLTDYPALV
ncbi:alkene reductase [Rhodobacter ferrooxidans]|uniref:NADH:flavin oxidoreductase/NADH oxidase n=1 Tax=Rhodobacter ferrooxidans TaxID=371731 RepID=C8RXC9_9RHOB|nr:alkene reductase [Rhodobacter sp. SW2]EEW26654.1 NADH:flavin oxidoreductase/NADH oxidase [Rhodobacter sp. SW2]